MKKLKVLVISILTMFSLIACSNKEFEDIENTNNIETVEDKNTTTALELENLLSDISTYTQGTIINEEVVNNDFIDVPTNEINDIYLEDGYYTKSIEDTNSNKTTTMKEYIKAEATSTTPIIEEVSVIEVIEPEVIVPVENEVVDKVEYIEYVETENNSEPIIEEELPQISKVINVCSLDGSNTSNIECLLNQLSDVLYDEYKKSEVYVISDLSSVGLDSSYVGCYTKGYIYLTPNVGLETVTHEFAHNYDVWNDVRSLLKDSYSTYCNTYLSFDNSDYGRESLEEFTAEVITDYLLAPGYLQSNYPDVYNIISSIL